MTCVRRSGHSLVELLFAMAILVVIMGVPGMILSTSGEAFGTSTSTTGIDLAARRALDRITARLTTSGLGGVTDPVAIVPGAPVTGVTFAPLAGFAAGTPVWGNAERFELRMAPGEVLDGTDTNGNGVIDDGSLVWIPDMTDPTRFVVLCNGVRGTLPGEIAGNGVDDNGNGIVDERGFVMVFVDDRVEITLALERQKDGRSYQRAAQRSVALRN